MSGEAQAKYRMFVEAIRANSYCRNERKQFNLIASTPIGRHVQPQIAKVEAINLIDCFERMRRTETAEQKAKKQLAVESLMSGYNSEELIKRYVDS